MNIQELQRHEKGILNVFNFDPSSAPVHTKGEDANIFQVRLSSQEYDSIFENPPSFYEKKAFVDLFRKKWRSDKGYCSLFSKRRQYKEARKQFHEKKGVQQLVPVVAPLRTITHDSPRKEALAGLRSPPAQPEAHE